MPKLTLTLIRGLPGSGKSTLAQKLVGDDDCVAHEVEQHTVHLETDMYFVNSDGEYHFQPEKLKQAHAWCLQQCEAHLKKLQNKKQQGHVIVANTFVKHWEMKAYQDLAKKYSAVLKVVVCRGKYKSIHHVPAATIKRMKQQWQP